MPFDSLLAPTLRSWARYMLWTCGGVLSIAVARAQTPAVEEQLVVSRLDPAAIVLGVVDYTRWPAANRPALVCATRGGAHSERLTPGSGLAGSRSRQLSVRLLDVDEAVPRECDVVVFEGWSKVTLQASLQAAAAHPVLTVGFGGDFCSDGGMVCLHPADGGWTFEINTDAVARSGLRVSPRVLQLTRPRSRAS